MSAATSSKWGFSKNQKRGFGQDSSKILISSPVNSNDGDGPGSSELAPRPRSSSKGNSEKRLMDICKDGNLEAARQYCVKNANIICTSINSPVDFNGNFPLHLTVSQNDHIMTCLLLLKGANPNFANKSGVTPLMIAERMSFSKIIDALTICGAISAANEPKSTPKRNSLLPQEKKKEKDILLNPTQGLFGSFSKHASTEPEKIDEDGKALVQASMETGIMILPDAAYLGFQNQIISVIRQDTLKDTDEAGSTVLMKAAYSGHTVLVKDLLDLGCDPDAMDKTGNTALVWAVLSGKGKVMQILYESGANIDGAVPYSKKLGIKIKGQMTPLIAASYHGHISMMKYLLKEKCDISLRCGNGAGKTALMVAACSRRVDAVKLLLQHNAPFDADYEHWLTKGSLSMKKTTTDRNAWVYLDGDKALHLCDQNSKYDLVSLESSSVSNSKNNFKNTIGNTLSYYSVEDHNAIDEIYRLLRDKDSLAHPEASILATTPYVASPKSAISTDVPTNPKFGNNNNSPSSGVIQRRVSTKRNAGYRNGLNLDKIIGTHSDVIMLLSEQMPNNGTELDELWVAVFQCVIQLVMAANKNIKQHYITISAKVNHCASDIVRHIESAERRAGALYSKEGFYDTAVKIKVRDYCKIITTDFPKQLMVATRMAIGVWPAPNAVSEMIKEAASLASSCRELTLLANTLGYFPLLDKTFDISFQPFEESSLSPEAANENNPDNDKSLKGGLSYAEYKRHNDLKLIQEMTKNMSKKDGKSEETASEEENIRDAEFFGSLDVLLKHFVQAATELKQIHDQHLNEEFINAASKVYTKADNLIEEITSFELFKEIGDDVVLTNADAERLISSGVKIGFTYFPVQLRFVIKEAVDELKITATTVMARGKLAASPNSSTTAQLEMLQSSIPCLKAVKKLVTIGKEAVVKVRETNIEERRKRDAWRKECLANEKVKQLFQMWESQVMTDIPKVGNHLTSEELDLLNDSEEGIVFEDWNNNKRVKGGKLIKLIEFLSSHNPTSDDEFETVFLMTHHSFCTSAALMDQLIKRYDITPPYGLNQRMFELFLDKKVVQVRLKVCHIMLHWIQNHFEEDFADNQFLIDRFRDFISKKVMVDFEQMGVQITDVLKKQLSEQERVRINYMAIGERPKPTISSLRFGGDPLSNLMTDARAFLDIDPLEMCRQLTLMEHELYSRFQPYECLDQIWEGHLKKEYSDQKRAPNPKRHSPGSSASDISKMIRHTNEFTFWIATSVVNNSQMKSRVNTLKYFITMAQHCKELNNLTAVTTIVAGLSMGAISRLHKTWKSLETKSPKLYETYKELQELVSPRAQYANYRKYLKEISVPAIPFLGVYLTDLTFLDLGNADFLPDTNFINFEKRRKVHQLIREIQKYQQTQYALQPVPQIQDFMRRLGEAKSAFDPNVMMTEDQLYDKSMEVEAKEESSDDDDSD